MKLAGKQITNERVSFLQVLRLVFVLFSLYLLRDAFFRWDGFKYYASFSEYIPAFSLVLVLWTLVAFVISIAAWVLFRLCEITFDRVGLRIRAGHILVYGVGSILFGILAWKIKRLLWTDIQTSIQLKSIVLVSVFVVSTYLTWMLRHKAERWFKIVQDRITPLTWLFGFLVMISVLIVSVYTFGTESYKPIPKEFTQSAEYGSEEKLPNIVLVFFDTLTARDMSLYGYQRNTTPFITRWAENATVFTRTEAENNHTTPATASLMTGKRVWTHQVNRKQDPEEMDNLVDREPEIGKHLLDLIKTNLKNANERILSNNQSG